MLATLFVKLFLTILLEYSKHSLSMMLLASGMLTLEKEWHLQSLSWLGDLEIIPAIGKFHLSAHKPDCFPRFSLMFVTGAGHMSLAYH